jgi:hypothetical protein
MQIDPLMIPGDNAHTEMRSKAAATPNSSSPAPTTLTTVNDDDESANIILTGQKHKKYEFEMMEISIRFKITLCNDNDCGMHLQHAATLQAMELSFSENDFKIIENNN